MNVVKTYLTNREIEILITLLKDSQQKLIKEAALLNGPQFEKCSELIFEHGRLEVNLLNPEIKVILNEVKC